MGGVLAGAGPRPSYGLGGCKGPSVVHGLGVVLPPRDCLGGVCLALRSRKLLNPAPIKGRLLKRLSPPSEGRRGGGRAVDVGKPGPCPAPTQAVSSAAPSVSFL